jgi:hypothetical protein
MADQNFRASISVDNQATAPIEAYTASLQAAAEAEQAVAVAAGEMAGVTTEAEGAAASAAAANEALAASSQTVAVAVKEETAVEQQAILTRKEMLEATSNAVEGNSRFMAALGPLGLAGMVVVEVVGQMVEQFNHYVEAGYEAELVTARFDAALRSNIPDAGQYTAAIKAAEVAGVQFGVSQSQVEGVLARIAPIYPKMSTDLRILAAAESLAAATGTDLETAARKIAVAMDTGGSGLQKMGVILTDASGKVLKHASDMQVLDAIYAKYGETATTVANTAAGANLAVEASVKDLDESIGVHMADMTESHNRWQASFNEAKAKVIQDSGEEGTVIAGLASAVGFFSTDAADSMVQWADTSEAQNARVIAGFADAYGNRIPGAINAGVPVIGAGIDLVKSTIDIADYATGKGHDVGFGFDSMITIGMAAGMPAIQGQANLIKGIFNSVITDFNNMEALLGASGIGYIGGAVPGSMTHVDAAASAAQQQRDEQAAWKSSGAGVTYLGAAEPYGHNPDTGQPFRSQAEADAYAKKAAGGGGGGGKGKTAQQLSDAAAAADKAQISAESEMAAVGETEKMDSLKGAVTAAQGEVTKTTALWDAAMKPLNNALDQAKAAMTGGQAAELVAMHNLDDEIYKQGDILKELQREATDALAPLEATLKADTAAMAELDAATTKADNAFRSQKEAIGDQQVAFEASAKGAMGPYEDTLNAANAALAAQQEAVQALSDKYQNQLFPIQQRLTELQAQQSGDQRAKQLEDEAQSVGNLAARLANAVKGSAEYNAIQKQMQEAQRHLGQDEEIDTLTTKEAKLTAERDKALKGANDQLKAAQEQQKVAQAARDAEAALLQVQRDALAERMTAITREAELYDRTQRDKKEAAQALITQDQAAIDKQKAADAQRQASTIATITGLNEQKTANQQAFNDAQFNIGQEILSIQGKAAQSTIAKDVAVANAKEEVTAAQSVEAAYQAQIDTRRKGVASDKAVDDYAKAFHISIDEARKKLNEMGPVADVSGKAIADIGTAATAAGNAIRNDLIPATGTMATTMGPDLATTRAVFMKYLGLSQDAGFDAVTSVGWFLDHKNPAGFWGRAIESAKLAVGKDGLEGAIDNGLDAAGPDITEHATGLGIVLDDGITAGVSDPAARGRLSAALIAAVKGAVADAATAIESSSPSKLTARLLGEPMGHGVAVGIDRTASQAATSMRNLTTGAVGSAAGASGGGGVTVNMNGPINFEFPDVRQMPTDPNDYRRAARAMLLATGYEATIMGLPRLQTRGQN